VVEVQLLSVDFSTGIPGNASIAYSSNTSISFLHSDIPCSRASAIATNLQLVTLSSTRETPEGRKTGSDFVKSNQNVLAAKKF
jgi:hypothetical protein